MDIVFVVIIIARRKNIFWYRVLNELLYNIYATIHEKNIYIIFNHVLQCHHDLLAMFLKVLGKYAVKTMQFTNKGCTLKAR